MGLITNSHRCLSSFQRHFALEGLFSVTLSSLDHGYMKPHPSIFEAALKAVDVEPAEAVMVGDSVSHDVEGARRLGMRGCPGLPVRGHTRQLPSRRPGDRVAATIAGPPLVGDSVHSMIVRALSTLAECRQVAALERQIWGYTDGEDVLPPAVLVVTIMRGGVLLGAFDETSTMKGYAYAAPAMKDGRPTLWSHALGVVPDARGLGAGVALKLAQRQHALRTGIDLIEWTADPLSATSAHLNFNKLGVLVEGYEEDLYGESGSALHGGAPTDRFMVEWHLSTPHVERRIGASTPANAATRRPRGTALRSASGTVPSSQPSW